MPRPFNLLDLIGILIFVKKYKLWSSSVRNFLHPPVLLFLFQVFISALSYQISPKNFLTVGELEIEAHLEKPLLLKLKKSKFWSTYARIAVLWKTKLSFMLCNITDWRSFRYLPRPILDLWRIKYSIWLWTKSRNKVKQNKFTNLVGYDLFFFIFSVPFL